MFDSSSEAHEYYLEELESKFEAEFYDEAYSKIIEMNNPNRYTWYMCADVEINQYIKEALQTLNDMDINAKSIEYSDYDDALKARYEDLKAEDDDFEDEYPSYDDWEHSSDWNSEVEFYQEIQWSDFQDNYEDELKEIGDFHDIHHLRSKISSIEDEINGAQDKLVELKEETMREIIRECFDD